MISKKTADDILGIIASYVDPRDVTMLLQRLSEVEGNTSFQRSMELLEKRAKEQGL
jgi:hypothetical protein